ncbi:hypothetical protein DEIPH_ctg031orf0095 [Deinococcus phoenicis]|uniref:Uncharacterized protein n=1 Tax=Deinococcus phoenicis TaxID=1476583 RepID=A0A016QPX8_9DEIO|nr:hypothetical protein DEIPH_ctg031orf0095 [Deinococcus phoenicis]
MFGPRLSFGPAGREAVSVFWDGVSEGAVWSRADDPGDAALFFLSAVHDAVLEGMGRRGEHPGPWADASPRVTREGGNLRLSLHTPDGQQAEVVVAVREL